MNSELFGRLVELLHDYGTEGEEIVDVYNTFISLDDNFVQPRLVAAAWLAKCGYNATALQLITEAAYYLNLLLPGLPSATLSKHYNGSTRISNMARRYDHWVSMTPSCQDAVDFHNANFAKDHN